MEELLEMTRDCFPDADLQSTDIRGSWAGVRPLILEAGKSTREMSRHDEVWIAPPGLVTVAGGKLTTYRPMARRILDAVSRARGRALPGTERTDRVGLPGIPAESLDEFRAVTRADLESLEVPANIRNRLSFLYGAEIHRLLAYGAEDPSWMDPLDADVPALRGEVRLAVETGMACTLEDIMDRRLALLLFAPDGGRAGAAEAASIARDLLGWDSDRRTRELERYETLAREHGPLRDPGSSVDTGVTAR